MTVVTAPSLLKKSLFVFYLLEAPWIALLIAGFLTFAVICNLGSRVPDVDKMHSVIVQQQQKAILDTATKSDSAKAKIKHRTKIQEVDWLSPEKQEQSLKQIGAISDNKSIPSPVKGVLYIFMALFLYAPWPVGVGVVALILSFCTSIWFLIHPFKKGLMWGLACIFIPFAAVVFEYKFWQEVRRPFELGLVSSALFGVVLGAAFGAIKYLPPSAMQNSFADEISEFKKPPATKMSINSSDVKLSQSADAFFEATLAAVANSEEGRAKLVKMVSVAKKGFAVTFVGSDAVEVKDSDISASKNRDKLGAIIETAFLNTYDVEDIRRRLAKDGTPAISIALQLLASDDVRYLKGDELSADEVTLAIAKLLDQGAPVVISAKNEQELQSKVRLASACYAVLAVDLETHQVLLYNCRNSDNELHESVPGVESAGNGLIKMPIDAFSQYVRYISFPDTWAGAKTFEQDSE